LRPPPPPRSTLFPYTTLFRSHSYERLAPQNPAAVLDTTYGIRSFIVGTGGTGLDGGSPPPVANSQVRNTNTWGVLKFTLNTGSRSEEHTSELQSRFDLVCRLL